MAFSAKKRHAERMASDPEYREQARRARKLDQLVERVDPAIVYEMQGGMCGICGQFIDGEFHVDHVIPLSRGGLHGYSNVQPAHPICNLRKGAHV